MSHPTIKVSPATVQRARAIRELHEIMLESCEAGNFKRMRLIEELIKERNVMEAVHLADAILREVEQGE